MNDFKPLNQLLTELEPRTSLQFHSVKENTPPTLPLNVRTTWFRILDERVQRGEIQTIGTSGFAVYAVIKSFADINSGVSQVGRETIAKLIGMSPSTVARSISKLKAHQWIHDATPAGQRRGRTGRYVIVERLLARTAETGEIVGEVVWNNVPRLQRTTEEALKEFCHTGELPVRMTYHRHLRVTELEETYEVVHNSTAGSRR